MSEEQLNNNMKSEENTVLIIMGIILGLFWVLLIVIDVVSETGLSGFIYFAFGIINFGAFLLYVKFKSKKSQDQWIKTSLFDEKDDNKINPISE